MAFNSAASLLFNIGANSDDAEEDIQRLRQLLGTNLDALAGQFSDWSEEVFGQLDTVKGAIFGITAAVGALGVAAAAFAVESAHKFEEYAIAVGDAAQKTGLTTQTLSAMHLVAHEVGVGFDQVVTGIVRFERSVFAAQDPTSKQAQLLARMGFTTAQVQGAMQNIDPFMAEFGRRFATLHEGPEKTGVAMEFMGRAGAANIKFLMQWAARAAELKAEAHGLGIELSTTQVDAARANAVAVKGLEMQWEAFSLKIGQAVLPRLTELAIDLAGVAAMTKHLAEDHTARTWFATTMIEGITGIKVAQKSLWESWIEGANEAANAMANAVKAEEAAATVTMLDVVPKPAKVKEATQEFTALTSILDGLKVKLGEMDSPEAKLAAELVRMRDGASKAAAELTKLQGQGKLATGVWWDQLEVLKQVRAAIAQYGAEAGKALGDKDLAEMQKFLDGLDAAAAALAAKKVAAGKELQEKIDAQTTQTFAHQVALWAAEVEKMRAKYAAEGTLSSANQALLEKLETSGLAKIYAEREAAYQRELTAARDHASKMLEADMPAEDKLAAQLQIELNKFSEVKAKELALTASTAKAGEEIERQYGAIRLALMSQYQNKLQELTNSQGWTSMFGDKFTGLIKNNEELTKQWSQSVNQSILLTQVAVESLGEMGEQAFDKLGQGMGAGIAHAVMYSKSIGAAMKSATEAVLESIAEQAMTQAIYALAWGFFDIAQKDYAGASAAFEAAALFGSIGFATAVAGRAMGAGSASASS